MKNKVIRSTVKKQRRPLVAGLLSLLFTGLGQYYNGEAAKGIVLFLLRIIPLLLLPAQNMVATGTSPVKLFFYMFSASMLVWLAAVPEAAVRAYMRGTATLKRYNMLSVYVLYAVLNTLVLSAVFMSVFMFFSLRTAVEDSMTPGIAESDVLLVKRGSHTLHRGDVIVYRVDGDIHISRIIGLPGDAVKVIGQTFTLNGLALAVGIMTPAELSAAGLPNREDIFFEINGTVRYPVRAEGKEISRQKATGKEIIVGPETLFIAVDNRQSYDVYETIETRNVTGVVSGVLFSASPGRFLADMTLPAAE